MKKILNLLLVLLLISVTGTSCVVSQADYEALQREKEATEQERDQFKQERDQFKQERDDLQVSLDELGDIEALEGKAAVVKELEKKVKELEEANALLEGNLAMLQEPAIQINTAPAGLVTRKETKNLLRERFPGASWFIIAYTKDPHQLASLEQLKDFLAQDQTDRSGVSQLHSYYAGDLATSRLRDQWDKAGLPPWSFGFIRLKRPAQVAEVLTWYPLFFGIENGEFVFYKVVPDTDGIGKVDISDISEETIFVIFDKLVK